MANQGGDQILVEDYLEAVKIQRNFHADESAQLRARVRFLEREIEQRNAAYEGLQRRITDILAAQPTPDVESPPPPEELPAF